MAFCSRDGKMFFFIRVGVRREERSRSRETRSCWRKDISNSSIGKYNNVETVSREVDAIIKQEFRLRFGQSTFAVSAQTLFNLRSPRSPEQPEQVEPDSPEHASRSHSGSLGAGLSFFELGYRYSSLIQLSFPQASCL